MSHRGPERAIAAADRALVVGIGGGGDVVGALAIARLCESLGTDFVLGGVAWERFAIDPHPGPWPLGELRAVSPIAERAALAGPGTATPSGVAFCESRMAGHLDRETVLIDVTAGPGALAESLVAAARRLGCDLAVYVDVGGDVLGHGDEPGLASPLCDAIVLSAAAAATEELPGIAAVFGPGCDGELEVTEVLARVAELARRGAWLGAWGMPPAVADELVTAARAVPTEASLLAARCARGEVGEAAIRGGRRTVRLGPLGALTFFFDPVGALDVAPLARAVEGAGGLEAARDALAARGVRTELDFERERAAEPAHRSEP